MHVLAQRSIRNMLPNMGVETEYTSVYRAVYGIYLHRRSYMRDFVTHTKLYAEHWKLKNRAIFKIGKWRLKDFAIRKQSNSQLASLQFVVVYLLYVCNCLFSNHCIVVYLVF